MKLLCLLLAAACVPVQPSARYDTPPRGDSVEGGDARECEASFEDDPYNCGSCGRTCIVPHAEAGCAARDCVVAACDAGWVDADGLVTNGCELENSCVADVACETLCGSSGRIVCTDGEGACAPPAESCNAADDDCNAACDDGAGCRAPVHRAYGTGHLYTTDFTAATTPPYALEAQNYFWIYAAEVPDTRPMFLCRKGDGTHLLTSDTACESIAGYVASLGYWAPSALCNSVPLYRLYHASSNDHFYTVSAGERDNAVTAYGYVDQGIAGHVWASP